MKIFIVGYSGAGKTRLSKLLSESFHCPMIDAEEWLKENLDPSNEFIYSQSELGARLESKLRSKPRSGVDFIINKYVLDQEYIIVDGIRNCFDFVHLFNPRQDLVVFLLNGKKPAHDFEKESIEAIQRYINFMRGRRLVADDQVEHIFISNKDSIKQYPNWVIDKSYFNLGNLLEAKDFLTLHIDLKFPKGILK